MAGASANEQDHVKEIALKGKMMTSHDQVIIGENYQSLVNLRYRDVGLEGIRGMTKVNTTALTTYLKARGAYHFRKDQPPESHVLAQMYNTGLTAAQVLENITAIPSAGDFSGTALWTDSTGFGKGRFSEAPEGTVAYCNGVDTCVWGGNEAQVGAFINYDPSGTFLYDYTMQVRNTINDANNVAKAAATSSGLDANVMLLLHLDNNVTDSSPATAHTVTNSNVTFTTGHYKFGTHSAVFASASSAKLTVPDDADFDFSGGIWSIDSQVYPTSLASIIPLYYQNTSTDADSISIWIGTDGSVNLAIKASSSTVVSVTTPASTVAVGSWQHIEVSENGDNYYIFVNGALRGYSSDTDRAANYTGDVNIGYNGTTYANMYLDEYRVSNTCRHTADFSPPSAAYSAATTTSYFYLGSVRPLKGFKIYIGVANTASGTMSVDYWTGTTFLAVSSLSDGTSSGGKTLAQTGSVTFTSTAAVAKVKEYNGMVLYFYRITLSAVDTSTTMYHVTIDAPFQTVKDIWDGSDREILSFQKYSSSTYNDNTTNVLENAYVSTDAGSYADISSLATATDYLLAGFDERMLGIRINVVGGYSNTNAAVATVYYWTGVAWTSVGTISDGTVESGKSLAKSGAITWNPPERYQEYETDVARDIPLFYYKIVFSANLSANVRVYYVSGIPAQEPLQGYEFPMFAQNRLFLCCQSTEKKNGWICSSKNTSSVFNGTDSAEGEIGNDEKLTAGVELFSQFGSSLYSLMLFFKHSETWVMSGDEPSKWESTLYRVSPVVGCVAPATLTVVNLPKEMVPGLNRNLVVWQGADGIYASDGRAPIPISDDIENYFDRSKSECITAAQVGNSSGFFDRTKLEYHWIFYSGTGATLTELIFDCRRLKWYKAERGTGNSLVMGVPVKDTYGNNYTYGFLDTGYMERLEYGTSMDGTAIPTTVWTGGIAPYNGSVRYVTRISEVQMVMKPKNTTSNFMTCTHYADGSSTGHSFTISPASTDSIRIWSKSTGKLNDGVFHSFKFTLSTNDETIGFEPIYLVIVYKVIREVKA